MAEKKLLSPKQSRILSLALYLVGVCVSANITGFSLYCLTVELTTGRMFNIVTGYFGGGYSYYNMDPAFFMISAALGFLLTVVLLWSVVEDLKTLSLIDRMEEERPA